MPSITHGAVAGFQVETELNQHLLTLQSRTNAKLSPAGLRAVLTALGTYYGSTLTGTQQATMPDFTCQVTAGTVTCYAAPGTEATLAAALITAVGANTVRA